MKVLYDKNIPFLKETLDNYCELIDFDPKKISNYIVCNSKAKAMFVRSTVKINEELLKQSSVKFVATATSGSDHLDKSYLENSGIYYADALGSNANSVAEYVIYAILKWASLNNIKLNNQVLGIIGFGSIGKLVANYGKLLGLKIIVNDPPLLDKNFSFPDFVEYQQLDSLLSLSDIITNHIPLTINEKYSTFELINQNNIKQLKNKCLFIHASRGKVVNEFALLENKCTKNLTLITDVWSNEPLFNKVLADNSLIATPHIAGHSFEGKIRGTLYVCEAFEKFFKIEIDKSIIYDKLKQYKSLAKNEFSNYSKLLLLLQTARNFEYDDAFFRELSKKSDEEIKKGFIDFRQQYPLRFETL